MEYTFMVGNGFDVGLGLKTRYSDFIRQYVISNGHSFADDTESVLKNRIRTDIETWSDAERAFAELPFSNMFEGFGDFHKTLLDLLIKFKTSLNGYLLTQVRKVCRRQITNAINRRFFAHMVESLFSGMPLWLREKELAELVDAEEFAVEPNAFNFVNFNYTSTFDSLMGVKTVEPTDESEFEEEVRNAVGVNILGRRVRFIRHHLIHVHGAFDTKDALFGVSELQQIRDDIVREFSLLSGYLYLAKLKAVYLPECMVVMRMGGASTEGWRSNIEINREDLRALRSHGIWSCLPLIYLKYLFKIWGFVLKK